MGTSAPNEMRGRSAHPEDAENFDSEGECVCLWLPRLLGSTCRSYGVFVFVGFVKSLSEYGTGHLGRITMSLCLKVCEITLYAASVFERIETDVFNFVQALLASRVTVSGARSDEHRCLAKSAEVLQLSEENKNLKKENEALKNLRISLKSQNELLQKKVDEQEDVVKRMQEKIDLDEEVLDNRGPSA